MLLKAICTPDVVCCGPATTIQAAAVLMRAKHTGDLVVVNDPDEERIPLGIITDRDIVVDVLAAGLNPATTTVTAILHPPVVVANENEDTSEALQRMRTHGVRRLPVVGLEGRLVGILTLDDILDLVAADLTAIVDLVARQQDREHRSRR